MRPEQALARARHWAGELGMGEVIAGQSTVGGGSLPEELLPTYLLALDTTQPNRFLGRLRSSAPPVIARVQDGRVVFDPRTVLIEQEAGLLVGIKNAFGSSG